MQSADTALRVLLVEDREDDAVLVIHALRQAGYVLDWRRVDTESAFLTALGDDPQLILTDYTLPHFDAPRAIRLLRERGDDVPCIVISGTIGDEEAVECLRAGADDYLLKDRWAASIMLSAARLENISSGCTREPSRQTSRTRHSTIL